MRKCERCQLTFYSNRRLYCLYCDSRLVEVYVDRETVFENLEPTAQKITAAREPMTHQRMEFLVGSYFKSKSFTFSYSFSRNQFKMGEKFPRFLIQPVRFDFLIKIPWLLIDLLDSILFRLVFNGFCPHCRWKHSKSFEAEPHDPRECEYNREYGIVVNAILNGEIAGLEPQLEEQALVKSKAGKKSAYSNLCSRKRFLELVIDVVTILFSIGLLIYFLTLLAMPIFGKIYDF